MDDVPPVAAWSRRTPTVLSAACWRLDWTTTRLWAGAYIGSAYWFTSSTSFANPAVTVGRAFTDTFAGIAPRSVPAFVVAQLLGGVIALGLAAVLYPDVDAAAGTVTVPHDRQSDFAGADA
jgi:glycerol uptake facilitator-like aquaporin